MRSIGAIPAAVKNPETARDLTIILARLPLRCFVGPERRPDMCSPDTIIAKYEGYGVDLLSKSPLVGSVELSGEDDEVINLKISRDDAQRLVAELSKFISAEVPA
jgi:hypothetical protein